MNDRNDSSTAVIIAGVALICMVVAGAFGYTWYQTNLALQEQRKAVSEARAAEAEVQAAKLRAIEMAKQAREDFKQSEFSLEPADSVFEDE